jgi:tetratricopeptide (TPR) repeat protein
VWLQACYDAARSCDPKLPGIWEAMACFEAVPDPSAPPPPAQLPVAGAPPCAAELKVSMERETPMPAAGQGPGMPNPVAEAPAPKGAWALGSTAASAASATQQRPPGAGRGIHAPVRPQRPPVPQGNQSSAKAAAAAAAMANVRGVPSTAGPPPARGAWAGRQGPGAGGRQAVGASGPVPSGSAWGHRHGPGSGDQVAFPALGPELAGAATTGHSAPHPVCASASTAPATLQLDSMSHVRASTNPAHTPPPAKGAPARTHLPPRSELPHLKPPPPKAASKAVDLYRHALRLGGGPEAALGFAAGALTEGCADAETLAEVTAALHRCLPLQPLNPALHHALALAHESNGDPRRAAASLALALQLLQSWPESRVPGSALLVPACGFKSPLLPVKLDLARVLTKCGEGEAARKMFKEVEEEGAVLGTYELLAYFSAVGTSSCADATLIRRAATAARSPEEAEAAAAVAAAVVPRGADNAERARLPPDGVARVWLAAGTASLAREDTAAAAVCAEAAARAARRASGSAALAADAAVLQGGALTDTKATRAACAAIHVCPWSPMHRALALRVMAAGPVSVATAVRICSTTTVVAEPATVCRLACRHAGPPLAGNGGSTVALAASASLQALRCRPWDPHSWYLASLLLAQAASQRPASAVRAAGISKVALRILQAKEGHQVANLRTHLHLAHSIALLATGDATAADAACQEAAGKSAAESLMQLQAGRVATAVGDLASADAALHAAAAVGSAPAVLLLAQQQKTTASAMEAILELDKKPPLCNFRDALRDLNTHRVVTDMDNTMPSGPFSAVWQAAEVLEEAEPLLGHAQRSAAAVAQRLLRAGHGGGSGRGDIALAVSLLEAEAERLQGRRGKAIQHVSAAVAWVERCRDGLVPGGLSKEGNTRLRFGK